MFCCVGFPRLNDALREIAVKQANLRGVDVELFALLPLVALRKLEIASPPGNTIRPVHSLHQLRNEMAACRACAVICDPGELSSIAARRLADMLDHVPTTLFVYSALTPTAFRNLLVVARHAGSTVALQSDDGVYQLRRFLASIPESRAVYHFLGVIRPRLANLQPIIRERVVALFSRGDLHFSPAALASVARTSRRSLDRHITRAGLGSTAHLIAIARLLHGHYLLRDFKLSNRAVAERLGVATLRPTDRKCRLLVGIGIRVAAETFTPPQFGTRLGEVL